MSFRFRDQIILRCYEITKDYAFFHEWFRNQIFRFQLPLIIYFFKILYGPKLHAIIPRHSLTEESGFNLFVSDLDLTFVLQNEQEIPRFLQRYDGLKNIFINLGEPEVLTQKEFKRILNIETPFFSSYWTYIFQLRKISWQLIKKTKSHNQLEEQKVERGLRRSLNKLNSLSLQIQLDDIFAKLPEVQSTSLEFPYYCQYLKTWIEIKTSHREHALIATTGLEASAFLGLLPGNQYQGLKEELQLQQYLLVKEIALSICQQRLLTHQGEGTQHLADWIQKLELCLSQIS